MGDLGQTQAQLEQHMHALTHQVVDALERTGAPSAEISKTFDAANKVFQALDQHGESMGDLSSQIESVAQASRKAQQVAANAQHAATLAQCAGVVAQGIGVGIKVYQLCQEQDSCKDVREQGLHDSLQTQLSVQQAETARSSMAPVAIDVDAPRALSGTVNTSALSNLLSGVRVDDEVPILTNAGGERIEGFDFQTMLDDAQAQATTLKAKELRIALGLHWNLHPSQVGLLIGGMDEVASDEIREEALDTDEIRGLITAVRRHVNLPEIVNKWSQMEPRLARKFYYRGQGQGRWNRESFRQALVEQNIPEAVWRPPFSYHLD